MSVEEQWTLLRTGNIEQGLSIMRKNFDDLSSMSHTVTFGLGLLWAERYSEAINHLQGAMRRYNLTVSVYFDMISVAHWCLGNPIASANSLRQSLDASYIDGAGGMMPALLLWIMSIFLSNDTQEREALTILRKKTKSPKVKWWPGVLGRYVVGEIDESALYMDLSSMMRQRTDPRKVWETAFYKNLFARANENLSSDGFREKLIELVDITTPIWTEEGNFSQLVRNPEFYIARYQAYRANQSNSIVRTEWQDNE